MKDLFLQCCGGMKQLRSKKAGTALDGIRLIMEDKTETTVLAKGRCMIIQRKSVRLWRADTPFIILSGIVMPS